MPKDATDDFDCFILELRLLTGRTLLEHAESKADAEGPTPIGVATRTWARAFRAVAPEAEAVLRRRHEEPHAPGEPTAAACWRRALAYIFTRRSPVLARLAAARDLRRARKSLNELVEVMIARGLLERRRGDRRWRAHDQSGDVVVVGRDGDREAVVKLLLEQERRDGAPRVVAVTGTRGMGKTTLVRMVHGRRRPGASAAAVGGRHRRFLLVLDDDGDGDEDGGGRGWASFVKPLLRSRSPPIGAPGSTVVVTSRSREAGWMVGTVPPHELAPLSEEDSWALFSREAFGGCRGARRPELVAVGRDIADSCGGVPLALTALGALVRGRKHAREWQELVAP